ncbi:MAG: cyclic nucleotide-binding protein [Rickettsiales bacterium]|nr:cyclic nucleotide-binding protein [Rickettsiales bacterium]
MQKIHQITDSHQIGQYFDVFFNYVRRLTNIPESDQELCKTLFKPVFVKRNTIIESEGTVHNYHNFIVSGFMRNFHHNDEHEEVTTDLNDGPRFFTSYSSFIHSTVSKDNLHCITDCQLLRISREDVDIAAQEGITQQEYSQKILEQLLEKNRQRAIELTTLTAKERYLKLMTVHPAIIQNVPLTYIASYLGIKAGSLSRIRNELD